MTGCPYAQARAMLDAPPSRSVERKGPRVRDRVTRLPRQVLRRSPFAGGEIRPGRVPLFSPWSGRPALPFPHPWNYREPLRILESFFWNAEGEEFHARHNRYLDMPGFAPVLVTRDPRIIREISSATGDRPGMFDRDTMPSAGIARATGADSLLYANGAAWKRQKRIAMPPFARTTLFRPERFGAFEETFRATVSRRLDAMRAQIETSGEPRVRVRLEDEIKAVMLELLVRNFFGSDVEYQELRDRYVPAIDTLIDHIVRDTVMSKARCPIHRLPGMRRRAGRAGEAAQAFERLTDLALAPRATGAGLWAQFQSDAPDEALRSNVRVFLAGALEATTSYASWAVWHLARHPDAAGRVADEVRDAVSYTPDGLGGARFLGHALDETLRLTPALYFHPRRATADTRVERAPGESLFIPAGTHILLDVWHANRHEDHWGVEVTGFRADRFEPDRWANIENDGGSNSERLLHFGFGHGPRFCPGKSLGQLEVALVVAAVFKLFRVVPAVEDRGEPARAGVSTKPRDGVLVDLSPR